MTGSNQCLVSGSHLGAGELICQCETLPSSCLYGMAAMNVWVVAAPSAWDPPMYTALPLPTRGDI